ncbi:LysE family transporter [uncultured Dokdonia sp.]|uniref:LysE family translocator n=1 Tax=uncultured Dokdonia sp. TaxID=575653 RepID=UPI00260D384E|nr:LysE family transporter [uncultured Dokdonia sp.]
MILSIFLIGFFATIIGAMPPGASNLAVIKTTVKENIYQSLKISYGSGIGEVLLAFTAFSSGMVVQEFFAMHIWLQFLIAGVLGVAGIYFIKTKQIEKRDKRKYSSKYLTGFALSVINPPVLIYWVLVFSLLRSSFNVGIERSSFNLILFFTGVFLGKVITLYGYGKLGTRIQKKKPDTNSSSLNRMIGIVLISLSLIQTAKLILF